MNNKENWITKSVDWLLGVEKPITYLGKFIIGITLISFLIIGIYIIPKMSNTFEIYIIGSVILLMSYILYNIVLESKGYYSIGFAMAMGAVINTNMLTISVTFVTGMLLLQAVFAFGEAIKQKRKGEYIEIHQ